MNYGVFKQSKILARRHDHKNRITPIFAVPQIHVVWHKFTYMCWTVEIDHWTTGTF
jgi:hypothetical protein